MRSLEAAPTTPQQILFQLGGAIGMGIVLAVAFYFLLGFALMGAGLGMGLLSIQIFGIIIGFGLGAGLGAGLVGRRQGINGNLWLAMLAGGLSGAAVILVMRLLNLNLGGWGLFGILAVGIVIALVDAVATYNLTARR
jgi:hypothetical protein